ncbi:MAG: hypothetical protein LBN95_11175 [Prevotellaceae bacterium]|jgi:hypothetical protein|nr:hypothetical protein [Prevotellaceae bacterium]
MKKTIFIAAMSLLAMTACTDKEAARETLLEENFAANHSEWQVSGDTIHKDIVIKGGRNQKYAVPFHLKWLTATDSLDNHRIAYYKFERTGGSEKAKIIDIVSYFFPDADNFINFAMYPQPVQEFKINVNVQFPYFGTAISSDHITINGYGDFQDTYHNIDGSEVEVRTIEIRNF